MKSPLFSAICLGLGLTFAAQAGHAAAISKSANQQISKSASSKAALPAEKGSLIEKAIHQQKNAGQLQLDGNLKMLTALKAAPTQNFLASQNQSFTRFVQALFPQHSS